MKLNHKIIGEGDPIVIMHGMFGMLDNWMSFAKKLSGQYQVILVDHRNHGKSPHSDKITYELYVSDLHELMVDLGIEKVHLIGHSMGGKTVQNFAITHPSMTASVISVDMGAHGYYKGDHSLIFNAVLPLDLSKYTRRSEVQEQLSQTIDELGVVQFLLKNLNRTDSEFAWKANFRAIHDSYDALRKEVDSSKSFAGKALFIRGEKSSYIRDSDFAYIQSIFSQAELVTIEGAGHWVHAEKPVQLFDAITSFLE